MTDDELDQWLKDNLYIFATPDTGDLKWKMKYKSILKMCRKLLNDDKKEKKVSSSSLLDWMHDDITWCRRTKCPNKECFRNQVNRRLKAGLISVADMYKEGKCPKEAVIEV